MVPTRRARSGGDLGLPCELLRWAVVEDVIWSEWHWTATPRDGPPLDEIGVALFGVHDARISWARLYIEPVEREGGDIEDQMRGRLSADVRKDSV